MPPRSQSSTLLRLLLGPVLYPELIDIVSLYSATPFICILGGRQSACAVECYIDGVWHDLSPDLVPEPAVSSSSAMSTNAADTDDDTLDESDTDGDDDRTRTIDVPMSTITSLWFPMFPRDEPVPVDLARGELTAGAGDDDWMSAACYTHEEISLLSLDSQRSPRVTDVVAKTVRIVAEEADDSDDNQHQQHRYRYQSQSRVLVSYASDRQWQALSRVVAGAFLGLNGRRQTIIYVLGTRVPRHVDSRPFHVDVSDIGHTMASSGTVSSTSSAGSATRSTDESAVDSVALCACRDGSTWVDLAPAPPWVAGNYGLISVGEDVYVFEEYKAARYCAEFDMWMYLPMMRCRRNYIQPAVDPKHEFVYVVGGSNATSGMRLPYDPGISAERYSIQLGQWEQLPNMRCSRWGPSLVVFDGMLIAIGGAYNDISTGHNGRHKNAEWLPLEPRSLAGSPEWRWTVMPQCLKHPREDSATVVGYC